MSDSAVNGSSKTPTIYFIDDSATMREVIKMAFRRESMRVIACHDAASALAQFGETAPDAVITDVIMPGKDGYEVCQTIKQDAQLSKTPVILMSGVVDRSVAEKAIAARADELIRKPFQPQELIARVKNLLNPQPPPAQEPVMDTVLRPASAGLSEIFTPPKPTTVTQSDAIPFPVPGRTNDGTSAIAEGKTGASANEIQKLRLEIQRIEMLVRKLQAELEAERQYVASLEAHVRKLQETR